MRGGAGPPVDLAAWLAVLDAGLEWGLAAQALRRFGGPAPLLAAADPELLATGFKPAQADRLRQSARDTIRRDRQLEEFRSKGMALLPLDDPAYPRLLREVSAPPPALFVRGELQDIDELAVAIVGPRLATPYGIEVARRLASEFAPRFTVLSGGAIGIDTVAHGATLDAGGRTIAVMACGLEQDYPQGNEPVRARIPGAGAIVSPFAPLTPPNEFRFPMRNHVLAGMALAVVVVEASEKSGALVTAHCAADEGRPVFAVPGDITRRNSAGTNQLLRDGASVVVSPGDVIEDIAGLLEDRLAELLRRRGASAPEPGPTASAPVAGSLEDRLLAAVAHHASPYDELLAAFVPSQGTMGEFTMALLNLEMTGRAKQLPGRVFIAGR